MTAIISKLQLQSGFITNTGTSVYPAAEISRILNFPDIRIPSAIAISHRKGNIDKKINTFSRNILLILCLNGNSQIQIDKKKYTLDSYSMCIILPNRRFQMLQKSGDLLMMFLYVTLSPDILKAILAEVKGIERFNLTPYLSISKEEVVDILDFSSFIIRQYVRIEDHPYHIEMTQKMLYALIYNIQDLYIRNMESFISLDYKETVFFRFRKLLIENYPVRQSSFYAEKLSYSPGYLSRIIKETSGKSISCWMDELILLDAKYQLTETNTTIALISKKLCFPTPDSFRSFFKKRAGISPRKYRNINKPPEV